MEAEQERDQSSRACIQQTRKNNEMEEKALFRRANVEEMTKVKTQLQKRIEQVRRPHGRPTRGGPTRAFL